MRHTTAILCVLLALLSAGPRTMAAALRPEKTASWGPALQTLTHAQPETPQVLDRVPETTLRDYEPAPGRPKWLNRDPIEEKGGLNIYSAVYNNLVGDLDILGREPSGSSLFPYGTNTVTNASEAFKKMKALAALAAIANVVDAFGRQDECHKKAAAAAAVCASSGGDAEACVWQLKKDIAKCLALGAYDACGIGTMHRTGEDIGRYIGLYDLGRVIGKWWN